MVRLVYLFCRLKEGPRLKKSKGVRRAKNGGKVCGTKPLSLMASQRKFHRSGETSVQILPMCCCATSCYFLLFILYRSALTMQP